MSFLSAGRRTLGALLAGLIIASVAVTLLWISSNGSPASGPVLSMAVINHTMSAGDTIQSADYTSTNMALAASTAALYYRSSQNSLFVGKTLIRSLPEGSLIAKQGDLAISAATNFAVTPIGFKVGPAGLRAGDILCVYALYPLNGPTPPAFRLFYPTPIVIEASGVGTTPLPGSLLGWQVTVPTAKAPDFLYAAANPEHMLLAAFLSSSPTIACPATPILSPNDAINGANNGMQTSITPSPGA